jgi:hypothetical protein
MKACLIVVLLGLFSFFGSSAVLAHNPGAYTGIPLTGGITIWGDSNGHTGYAGNVSLGFTGAYANHGYAAVPYYGPSHGPSCGHVPPYGYARGYKRGYRNGHHNRRNNRHHYNDHRGRHH